MLYNFPAELAEHADTAFVLAASVSECCGRMEFGINDTTHMHLSKLVHVLGTFDEAKIKRLKDYVHSPYFHVPLSAINLFDYLYEQHPAFSENKIEPCSIARKYKNLATPVIQAAAGSRLMHSIEHFLGLEHAQRHQPATALHQVHGSREHKLHQYLRKDYSRVMKHINEHDYSGYDVFYHRHLFAELAFNERDLRKRRGEDNSIAPVITSLDAFHALKKLRYLSEALSRGQKMDKVCERKQVNALLKTLQPFNQPRHPCVYLLVLIYRLQTAKNYKESTIHYQQLKDFAARATNPSALAAISDAAGCIINYCLLHYNKGREEMGKEYLFWQEWRMNNGSLLEEGHLNVTTFRNIVAMAVSHHSSAWLKAFIEFFSEDLPQQNLEANLAFGLGLLLYKEMKYKEALRTLLRAQPRDEPLFNCVIRRWQWLCSYEYDKADKEGLHNQLLSFTRYLHRNKAEIGNHLALFETFIYHASKMLCAGTGKASPDPIGDLMKEGFFPGKRWMEEQLRIGN